MEKKYDDEVKHDVERSSTCTETDQGGSRTTPDGLHPQDGGFHAWINLAALSSMLMVTWGYVSAYGVFRQWYFQNPPFQGNQILAEIGVLSVGILQMMTPFLLRLLDGRSHWRKWSMAIGGVFVVAGAVGAAFAETAGALIALLGALYGIGSGLLFAPSISLIDEWFLERRGLANGIYFGSNNISAAWWSPVFSALLSRFGPKPVLISWGIFAGVVIFLAILVVHPREPVKSEAIIKQEPVTWKPFRKPLFWLVALSVFLQGLANMLPATYIPTYATDLGISSTKASLLLTVLNICGMVGQVAFGFLIDAVGILIPLLLSTLISAFSVLVIWGIGREYWSMMIFVILFGAFSFSFIVLRSHFAAAIVGDKTRSNEITLVSGALMSIRGVACIISGFIGDAAASGDAYKGVQGGYGAGLWQAVILTVGCLMLGATVSAFGFIRKPKP